MENVKAWTGMTIHSVMLMSLNFNLKCTGAVEVEGFEQKHMIRLPS